MNNINRIGGKVLCKRGMSNRSKHRKLFFKKGEWYDVFSVSEYSSNTYISVINERGYQVRFSIDTINRFNRYYRYFYNDREIRRIKLERIGLI